MIIHMVSWPWGHACHMTSHMLCTNKPIKMLPLGVPLISNPHGYASMPCQSSVQPHHSHMGCFSLISYPRSCMIQRSWIHSPKTQSQPSDYGPRSSIHSAVLVPPVSPSHWTIISVVFLSLLATISARPKQSKPGTQPNPRAWSRSHCAWKPTLSISDWSLNLRRARQLGALSFLVYETHAP